MINSVHNSVSVTLCKDASDAVYKGFHYREPVYKPIEIKQVVVVQNGTESGKPTVDFILEDDTGQKFVFMITSKLLKSIPCG